MPPRKKRQNEPTCRKVIGPGFTCGAYPAAGNPPLCYSHGREAEFARARPGVDWAELVRLGLGIAAGAMGGAPPPGASSHWSAVNGTGGAISARELLGFAEGEALTVERVKQRRRELALAYHTDRGAGGTMLARINAACDELIQELGG